MSKNWNGNIREKPVPDPFELLNRHVRVSRETFDKLSLYHDLVLKWQPKINLVGPDTIHQMWERHFLDSLQLLNYIDNLSLTIADLGSGAGFPGMALAIAGANDVHLIESDKKKIVFLQEIARITKTNLSIHSARIEACPIGKVSIVISRACAPLVQLLHLASPYVSHETICLFHKGKNYFKEIGDAKEEWSFDHAIFPSITDDKGAIIRLWNVNRRGNHDGGKRWES